MGAGASTQNADASAAVASMENLLRHSSDKGGVKVPDSLRNFLATQYSKHLRSGMSNSDAQQFVVNSLQRFMDQARRVMDQVDVSVRNVRSEGRAAAAAAAAAAATGKVRSRGRRSPHALRKDDGSRSFGKGSSQQSPASPSLRPRKLKSAGPALGRGPPDDETIRRINRRMALSTSSSTGNVLESARKYSDGGRVDGRGSLSPQSPRAVAAAAADHEAGADPTDLASAKKQGQPKMWRRPSRLNGAVLAAANSRAAQSLRQRSPTASKSPKFSSRNRSKSRRTPRMSGQLLLAEGLSGTPHTPHTPYSALISPFSESDSACAFVEQILKDAMTVESPGQRTPTDDSPARFRSQYGLPCANLDYVISRYHLHEKLGEGAYGKVYKGFDDESGAVVAIKIMSVKNHDGHREERENELLNEIKILQMCQSPYVTQYLDAHLCSERRTNDRFWIVLEFCDMGSLVDLINSAWEKDGRTGSLSEKTIKLIATFILLGLEFLHSKQIIHRDLKGGNVLLTSDGCVKIADFGVSRQLNSATESFAQTLVGTPVFAAPEVLMSGTANTHYDQRVDVWSFGIVMIELCQTQLPYQFQTPYLAMIRIPHLAAPTLRDPHSRTTEMNEFIAQCVIKDPASRPTATQLLGHAFLADAVRELEPDRQGRLQRRSRRESWKNQQKLLQISEDRSEDHGIQVVSDTPSEDIHFDPMAQYGMDTVDEGDHEDSLDSMSVDSNVSSVQLSRSRAESGSELPRSRASSGNDSKPGDHLLAAGTSSDGAPDSDDEGEMSIPAAGCSHLANKFREYNLGARKLNSSQQSQQSIPISLVNENISGGSYKNESVTTCTIEFDSDMYQDDSARPSPRLRSKRSREVVSPDSTTSSSSTFSTERDEGGSALSGTFIVKQDAEGNTKTKLNAEVCDDSNDQLNNHDVSGSKSTAPSDSQTQQAEGGDGNTTPEKPLRPAALSAQLSNDAPKQTGTTQKNSRRQLDFSSVNKSKTATLRAGQFSKRSPSPEETVGGGKTNGRSRRSSRKARRKGSKAKAKGSGRIRKKKMLVRSRRRIVEDEQDDSAPSDDPGPTMVRVFSRSPSGGSDDDVFLRTRRLKKYGINDNCLKGTDEPAVIKHERPKRRNVKYDSPLDRTPRDFYSSSDRASPQPVHMTSQLLTRVSKRDTKKKKKQTKKLSKVKSPARLPKKIFQRADGTSVVQPDFGGSRMKISSAAARLETIRNRETLAYSAQNRLHGITLQRFRGRPGTSSITVNLEIESCANEFCTYIPQGLTLGDAAMCYMEVVVLGTGSADTGNVHVGLAFAGFRTGSVSPDVGDGSLADPRAFFVSGLQHPIASLGKPYTQRSKSGVPCRKQELGDSRPNRLASFGGARKSSLSTSTKLGWSMRDVVGVAIHRPSNLLRVSVNGRDWQDFPLATSGKSFKPIDRCAPAICVAGETVVRVNLGQTPFVYGPPSDDYGSFMEEAEHQSIFIDAADYVDARMQRWTNEDGTAVQTSRGEI